MHDLDVGLGFDHSTHSRSVVLMMVSSEPPAVATVLVLVLVLAGQFLGVFEEGADLDGLGLDRTVWSGADRCPHECLEGRHMIFF